MNVKDALDRLEDLEEEEEPRPLNPVALALAKETSKITWRTLRKTDPEDGLIV